MLQFQVFSKSSVVADFVPYLIRKEKKKTHAFSFPDVLNELKF